MQDGYFLRIGFTKDRTLVIFILKNLENNYIHNYYKGTDLQMIKFWEVQMLFDASSAAQRIMESSRNVTREQ